MTAVSQKEYLKKYLSVGDDKPKKKKKKKQVATKRNVMIFDDDVDFKSLQPSINQGLQEAFEDEAPTVAEVIDERPKEEVLLEAYRKSKKWKVINKNGEGTDKGISTDVREKKSRHRIRHDSDSDMSPQRSSAPSKTGTPNLKPYSSKSHRSSGSSKGRPDSDSDQSPVRNRSKVSGNSLAVESKNMREGLHSESDLSPERTVSKSRKEEVGKQKHNQRHDSDSDISPVRTSRRHDSDSDISPVRTSRRHDSDSDLSPERPSLKDNVSNQTKIAKSQLDKQKELKNQNKRRHDSDSDLSPPRKAQERSDSDLPPPRGNESDSDLSPDRRKSPVGSDSDLSPPRQRDKDESRGRKKATKTLAGTSAGLQDAATLKRENEDARQRQAKMFDSLDDEVLGKNAKTIFRDRSGKKRNLQEEKQKEKEEAAKVEKENEKFVQWGKGLAQKQQHEAAVADALHEMSKPLARYQDDKDLDAILRDQDREGDPMLAFIRKKESKQKEKAGIKEKPKYKGPPGPPNRFNIPPGYRWDGVDRSNGFEKKFFTRMSDKRAMEEVKYKWSVEDM